MGLSQSMVEKQQENMKKNMERQMRIMTATQMSYTREMIPWMATPYSILVLGVLGRTIAKKPVPGAALIPVVIGGVVLGYQIDFAYGTKADRVHDQFLDILNKEDHWFSKKN